MKLFPKPENKAIIFKIYLGYFSFLSYFHFACTQFFSIHPIVVDFHSLLGMWTISMILVKNIQKVIFQELCFHPCSYHPILSMLFLLPLACNQLHYFCIHPSCFSCRWENTVYFSKFSFVLTKEKHIINIFRLLFTKKITKGIIVNI